MLIIQLALWLLLLILLRRTQKPVLTDIHTEWVELDDESGIRFIIYSDNDEVLFDALFDYMDVDSDAIYDSAVELAVAALSQKYDISDEAMQIITGEE